MTKKDRIRVVILAGGMGKRMKSGMPKVLTKVKGRSMIEHLLLSVKESGVDDEPLIVVGYKKEEVKKELGKNYNYAIQTKQLGTGHALLSAEKFLKNKSDHVVVLYGDHPLVSARTIIKIKDKHLKSKSKITLATTNLPDFSDWRVCFENFSRIIRNKKGEIIKSIEKKDATENEMRIKEVNPCYFCFESKWLWKKLKTVKNNNVQKEYYLTDLINGATDEGIEIESVKINPHEALGANTPEELAILEKFVV